MRSQEARRYDEVPLSQLESATLKETMNTQPNPLAPWLLPLAAGFALASIGCGSVPLDRCAATRPSFRFVEPACWVDAGAPPDAAHRDE